MCRNSSISSPVPQDMSAYPFAPPNTVELSEAPTDGSSVHDLQFGNFPNSKIKYF